MDVNKKPPEKETAGRPLGAHRVRPLGPKLHHAPHRESHPTRGITQGARRSHGFGHWPLAWIPDLMGRQGAGAAHPLGAPDHVYQAHEALQALLGNPTWLCTSLGFAARPLPPRRRDGLSSTSPGVVGEVAPGTANKAPSPLRMGLPVAYTFVIGALAFWGPTLVSEVRGHWRGVCPTPYALPIHQAGNGEPVNHMLFQQ